MAVVRSFAVEDKDLGSRSIIASRSRLYKDIDLTLAIKPDGDIFKKTDAAAVKQAIKTLILTNFGEKPFQPFFGGNIRALLFELANDLGLEDEIKYYIELAVNNFEPRAEIISIDVNLLEDANDLRVTIEFKILSTEEVVIFTTDISRIR
jgi:phage baseplate assembly protein W